MSHTIAVNVVSAQDWIWPALRNPGYHSPPFIRSASESRPPRTSGAEIAKASDVRASVTADIATARLPRPDHPELLDEVWDMIEKYLESDPDEV